MEDKKETQTQNNKNNTTKNVDSLKELYSSIFNKFNINIEDLTKEITEMVNKNSETSSEDSTKKIIASIQEKTTAIANKMVDDLLHNKDIKNNNAETPSSKDDKKADENKIIEN